MSTSPVLAAALWLCGTPVSAAPRTTEVSAAQAYEQARRPYFQLKASPEERRFRHHWLKAIAGFNAVASSYPESPQAARALYTAGELWSDLYVISRRAADLDRALNAYGRVAREHPGSKLADDSLWRQAQLALRHRHDRAAAARTLEQLLARYPAGDMTQNARALWPEVADALPKRGERPEDDLSRPMVGRHADGEPPPSITEVKHWSNNVYSRVVVYLSGPAEARERDQAPTTAAQRFAVDLLNARVREPIAGLGELQDELLAGASLEPQGDAGVSLTLELKRPAQHRLLVLENPYRVIVDAFTVDPRSTLIAGRGHRVVLDPGHGGADGGARSSEGVLEKDTTLAIAKEAEVLLAERGIDVVLTRSDDRHVGLEERTAIANRAGADLFVSIHANAYTGPTARGVETYYLDTTDDRYALRLAARENSTAEDQVSEVQLVLADLATKINTRESRSLATEVQRALVAQLKPLNARLRDLGARGSLFYILLGARMPAILVETSFLSNPEEGRLLGTQGYRHAAAQGIARAVAGRLGTPIVVAQP
jgi:N-acetylmuramoyl-L-alanine amidase